MVREPFLTGFGSVERCQVPLEDKICISKKLFKRWKHGALEDDSVDFGLEYAWWTNTSR